MMSETDKFVAKCQKLVDDLDAQREQIDHDLDGLVAMMRERGMSWARIGDVLGVSAQAAHQRWA
jgi:hypothetical protein